MNISVKWIKLYIWNTSHMKNLDQNKQPEQIKQNKLQHVTTAFSSEVNKHIYWSDSAENSNI